MAASRSKRPRGTPRGSRAVARETSREALIAAAIRLFAKKGLDVSLDELCTYAGYTRGAFYVHFADRDDLIAVVMERVSRASLDILFGPASQNGLDRILRRFARRLREGDHPMTRTGGVRPFQLLDACARSPKVRDGYVSVIDMSIARIAEVLRSNQKTGAARPDIDAARTAMALEAMAIGFEVLHDLDMPIDFEGCTKSVMALLSGKRGASRGQ